MKPALCDRGSAIAPRALSLAVAKSFRAAEQRLVRYRASRRAIGLE